MSEDGRGANFEGRGASPPHEGAMVATAAAAPARMSMERATAHKRDGEKLADIWRQTGAQV